MQLILVCSICIGPTIFTIYRNMITATNSASFVLSPQATVGIHKKLQHESFYKLNGVIFNTHTFSKVYVPLVHIINGYASLHLKYQK